MSASLPQSVNLGLAPGTIIGDRYRIDGPLGAGGMGIVLSATHLELGAPVAIKIVRDELAQNEAVVSQLLFEARAVARMKSAHVVRVLDVARLDTGAPYIVMEQLEGSDLQVVLAERGALSVSEAVCHVLQACEGLAEAHGMGIIHRDLKPENLFLATTPEGLVLKILDFGISKYIGTSVQVGPRSTLTTNGSAVGSPMYMSPEQMRASPNLDVRADIWSLGAILFELVTGRCPFEADSPAQLCSKVMCEAAPSLLAFSSTAPRELDAIVRRCLQKEADRRFQTVGELAEALRGFSAGEERAVADSERLASGISLRAGTPRASRAALPFDASELSPFPKKTRSLLLGVGALFLIAGGAFWQLQGRLGDRWWLGAPRATAAELTSRPIPEIPPAPAPSQPASTAAQMIVAPSAILVAPPALGSPTGNSSEAQVLAARAQVRARVVAKPSPAVSRQPEQRQPEQRQPEQRQPEQRQPEQRQPEQIEPALRPDDPATRYGL